MRTVKEARLRTAHHLKQLDPVLAQYAYYLVSIAWAVGVPLAITSSRRSEAEQRQLVDAGLSRTMQSAHLKGLAFDVDVLGISRDAVPRWFWHELGEIGEGVGLVWGGRWRSIKDYGHFEHP